MANPFQKAKRGGQEIFMLGAGKGKATYTLPKLILSIQLHTALSRPWIRGKREPKRKKD